MIVAAAIGIISPLSATNGSALNFQRRVARNATAAVDSAIPMSTKPASELWGWIVIATYPTRLPTVCNREARLAE